MESPDTEMRRRSRRSFIVAALAAGTGFAGWRWLRSRALDEGLPWPVRETLGINERLSRLVFGPQRLVPQTSDHALLSGGPRVNGDIGLNDEMNTEKWRLQVEGTSLALTLEDLKKLPEVSQTTTLNCIEGWTTVGRWTGVKLADFTDRFFPQGRSNHFVGMYTPDRTYYVGLDAPSAFHPQTLLCYAIDGKPLSGVHGAPLRLVIPTKYGIKNLKKVGQITYSDTRPADYWAEQGYDWYAGL